MTFFRSHRSWTQAGSFVKTLILDLVALGVILLVPILAGLIHFPFYMAEPMRMMVVIAVAHSSRTNSYLLALALPLFSWIVTGHPEFLKMVIVAAELSLNVFLFFLLLKKIRNVFLAMFTAILASKVFCYALYPLVFSWPFLLEEARPAFLAAQVITTLIFSIYLSFMYRKKIV